MTKEEIEELARTVDNVELTTPSPGMVTMVWQDGEVTAQKCGDLLWQRSLHCFEPPITGANKLEMEFPHTFGANSFAWVTSEDAYRVRQAIKDLLGDKSIDHLSPLLRKEEGQDV